MGEPEKKADKTLHGNQARIEPSAEPAFFCHSYEQKAEPRKFGLESLPGSKADLKHARDGYQDKAWEERKNGEQ